MPRTKTVTKTMTYEVPTIEEMEQQLKPLKEEYDRIMPYQHYKDDIYSAGLHSRIQSLQHAIYRERVEALLEKLDDKIDTATIDPLGSLARMVNLITDFRKVTNA
jgi:hypothetical protein